MNQQNLVLKAKQKEALFHLYNDRDVFAWFPTGYGKSICFQLIPFLLDFKLTRSTVPQVERSVVLVKEKSSSNFVTCAMFLILFINKRQTGYELVYETVYKLSIRLRVFFLVMASACMRINIQ